VAGFATLVRAQGEIGPTVAIAGAPTAAEMRIQISDPELLGSLMDFLRRCGCVVAHEEEGIVAVSIPGSLHEEAARLELDQYLRVWEAIHPGARAVRL
jgi:hypothetical protein